VNRKFGKFCNTNSDFLITRHVCEKPYLSQSKLIMKRTVRSPCNISVIPLSPGYIIPSALSRYLSACPTCFESEHVARELIKVVVGREKGES